MVCLRGVCGCSRCWRCWSGLGVCIGRCGVRASWCHLVVAPGVSFGGGGGAVGYGTWFAVGSRVQLLAVLVARGCGAGSGLGVDGG